MELVSTRFDPPPAPDDLVARTRLTHRLEELRGTRLTLLQAPAGYGKTTLMSQWLRTLRTSREAVSWLCVDALEGSAAALIAHLAQALAPRMPRRQAPHRSGTPSIALLVNALQRFGNRHYVFIDDIHGLQPDALQALFQVIERSPSGINYILASRAIPAIPLARMRTRGELRELGVEDLKFTPIEARHYLGNAALPGLDESRLSHLLERTEGWITGIRLAALMLRKSNPQEMLTGLTGSRLRGGGFLRGRGAGRIAARHP